MAVLETSQVRTTLAPFKIGSKIAVMDCFECRRILQFKKLPIPRKQQRNVVVITHNNKTLNK
jgi:hypothetical protein